MSSVGQQLADERRKQGKTLAEVEAATRVMGRLLEALEHDRYDSLPSPVYVKGYITAYAQFLGIPAAPLLAQFSQAVGQTEVAMPSEVPHRTVVQHPSEMHAVPFRRWLTIAAAIVGVGVVLWAISGVLSSDETPPPIPPETTSTPVATATVEPGVSTAETTPTVDGSGETDMPSAGTPFTMVISVSAGSASWLRVTVDGLKAYEGTLPGGESKEWAVSDNAVVLVGKPEAVTVTRDGVEIEIPSDGSGTSTVELTAVE